MPKSPRSASGRGGGAKARRGALYRRPDAIPARPLGNRAAWTPISLRRRPRERRSRRRPAASRLPAAIRTLFHPAVANWFAENFAAPTPAQAEAWPAIKAGRHTLIAAPTGSGKTLAAFLAAIDALVEQGVDGTLTDTTQVVYVSPLMALSNDIQRNLETPLAGIREELKQRGMPDVEIRMWVRTGDTPSAERERMRRRPRHRGDDAGIALRPPRLESGRGMLETRPLSHRRRNPCVSAEQAWRPSCTFTRTACRPLW